MLWYNHQTITYEPPLHWWIQKYGQNAPAISAEPETEDGGTETNERPDRIEHSPPTVEQIEDNEPEEWDKDPDFAEYKIQNGRRTDRI